MSEDKDKAPERVWLTVFDDDKDPRSTMMEWRSPVVRSAQPGDFAATRPHHKIAYVPESKVREAREEAFREAVELVQAVTNDNDLDDGGFFEAGFIAARTKSIDVLIETRDAALERAADSREGGDDGE